MLVTKLDICIWSDEWLENALRNVDWEDDDEEEDAEGDIDEDD